MPLAAPLTYRPGIRLARISARACVAIVALTIVALALPRSGSAANGAVWLPVLSRAIEDEVNAARAGHSAPLLARHDALASAARDYAGLLASRGAFAHSGPDGSSVASRAETHGYVEWRILAENLATGAGAPTASDVRDAWMRSPAHRRNLLAPELRDLGAACYAPRTRPTRYVCVLELGARSGA